MGSIKVRADINLDIYDLLSKIETVDIVNELDFRDEIKNIISDLDTPILLDELKKRKDFVIPLDSINFDKETLRKFLCKVLDLKPDVRLNFIINRLIEVLK
jgi:hypothetical protein